MASELSPSLRNFFQSVVEASFSNPFGKRREEIDAQILGTRRKLPHAERSALLGQRVAQVIQQLEREGLAHLDRHAGEDRDRMEVGFLFLIYQESFAELDAHIDRALAAAPSEGGDPIPFPGGARYLEQLRTWGFPAEEASRYLAICYQLRRAHRFIDRGLVGRSAAMTELRRQLWNAAVSSDMRTYAKRLYDRMEDFSTLLLGETGAGKGRAAAALGRSGFIPFDEKRGTFRESFTRAFLSTNLSQFPEALLPSELFGHRKGAFTGAIDDHDGIFQRCSPYGSILLDEIGEVSIPVQIQLLRVLQERTFSPVGGTEELRFRGRVIAATNQSIDQRREEGEFRDDFYYRLSSDVITVPPLRDRLREEPEERAILVEALLERMLGGSDPALIDRVLTALDQGVPADYAWPGNVRELEQAIRRILLTKRYVPKRSTPDLPWASTDGDPDVKTVIGDYCVHLYRRSGNQAEVARTTGLDRRTVRKYLIERGEIGETSA